MEVPMKPHFRAAAGAATLALLLVLTGCDGTPVGPELTDAGVAPRMNKSELVQQLASRTDLAQTSVGEEDPEEWLGNLVANIRVFRELEAGGRVRLGLRTSDPSNASPVIVFIIYVHGATLNDRDGLVRVEFWGEGEVCFDDRRECQTEAFEGGVEERRADDALWRLQSNNWFIELNAPTLFISPGDRGSVHGFFHEQPVFLDADRGLPRDATFGGNFAVNTDGTTSGNGLWIDITDPAHPATLTFDIREGTFAVNPDGVILVLLMGTLEIEADGETRSYRCIVTVHQPLNEDDINVHFHSDNYNGRFEAVGSLTRSG
jgi:hypothetical protein